MKNLSASIERVPAWAGIAWLHAGFSTRLGGHSQVYGMEQQNLGWTAEDEPETVARNRHQFLSLAADGHDFELVTQHQLHGDVVRDMGREPEPLMSAEGRAIVKGDGMITGRPGQMLGVLTADCVPVLIVDPRRRAVGAFHAGWRGSVGRIVEQGVAALRTAYGSEPEDLLAAIGPAIGACCFEVGDEVCARFLSSFAYADQLIADRRVAAPVSDGALRYSVDLHEANRRQLLAAGVLAAHISSLAECTACARLPDGQRKYFSHRAERGVTGRMMSVIGIREGVDAASRVNGSEPHAI